MLAVICYKGVLNYYHVPLTIYLSLVITKQNLSINLIVSGNTQ